MVFLLSPHHHPGLMSSTRQSGKKASTPIGKKPTLVVVDLSEASLHNIIHSYCPALERLLLVFGKEICICCLQINSPHLVSIGISFKGDELIIKDAPSLQRLHLDYRYAPSQITVVSTPKLKTLGLIPDPFEGYKMVVGSTLIQVLYNIINTFVIISCIFHLCA